MSEVSVNQEQQLFVIPCAAGSSCLGFEVLEQRCVRLLSWLVAHDANFHAPMPAVFGTLERYAQYEDACNRARDLCVRRNIRCDVELTRALIGLEGKRIEVTEPTGAARRFKVGKSTGWLPVHLELANARSSGGPAVLWTEGSTVRVVA